MKEGQEFISCVMLLDLSDEGTSGGVIIKKKKKKKRHSLEAGMHYSQISIPVVLSFSFENNVTWKMGPEYIAYVIISCY